MNRLFKCIIPGLILLLFPEVLFAGWTGPEIVATGTWGEADNQFTVESTDMGDIYPEEFFVLDDGTVVIEDGKLKIYRNKKFAHALDLSGHVFFCDQAVVVLPWSREDEKPADPDISFYPSGGKPGWKVPTKTITGSLEGVRRDCTFLTNDKENVYRRYSSTGQLLETMHDASILKKERLNNGGFSITIRFSNEPYIFIAKNEYPYAKYVQVGNKLLYGINGRRVDVIDRSGKIIDHMDMPKDMRFQGEEDEHAGERHEFAHDVYGEPFVDFNGNIYAWKRTPTSFRILKWTRKAEKASAPVPDPPQELMATTVSSGLYLTWKASPQDPGFVTSYDISRASEDCGPYAPLAVVDNGVLKYKDSTAEPGKTYYYKIRAAAGKNYSAWAVMTQDKKIICPGDDLPSKVIRYFEKKIYIADQRKYTTGDIELWKALDGDCSGNEKKLMIRALRNEIYARHGRIFQTQELKQIFEPAAWYKPKKEFSDAELSALEKKNVEVILHYEKKMGWR